MRKIELMLRKEADTAREQIRSERRKQANAEARHAIDKMIVCGVDRIIAVNFALHERVIDIVDRKDIRRSFEYGCHTICSMLETLYVIPHENSFSESQNLVEAI